MPSSYSSLLVTAVTLETCRQGTFARDTVALVVPKLKNRRTPFTAPFSRPRCGVPQCSEATGGRSNVCCFCVERSSEELLDISWMPLSTVLSRNAEFNLDDYALPPPPPGLHRIRKGQRIVSFGDVHGDIDALKEFLVVAGVMDPKSSTSNPKWVGGETICVQVGDVLDRGDNELACLRLLTSLSRQAIKVGGALVMLFGNHESMNAAGRFEYTNHGGNEEYDREIGKLLDAELGSDRWRLQFAENQPARWAAHEPGGVLAEPLLANMNVAIVVGRTVFVHAGLKAEHIRRYGGVEGMNQAVRDWISQDQHGGNNNLGVYKSADDVIKSAHTRATRVAETMPECISGGKGSDTPVWMRCYSKPADIPPTTEGAQQMIDDALKELGGDVQRMVMGHTPQHHINAALDGKAWRVDVGASSGVMNGEAEVLEIIHGGDEMEDTVNILTTSGTVVSTQRQLTDVGYGNVGAEAADSVAARPAAAVPKVAEIFAEKVDDATKKNSEQAGKTLVEIPR